MKGEIKPTSQSCGQYYLRRAVAYAPEAYRAGGGHVCVCWRALKSDLHLATYDKNRL